MAKGDMTISISPAEIMGSEVMKSGEYKYARVSVKKSDKQYMSISCEWQDAEIPEFVMALFDFMKANKDVVDNSKLDSTDEYASLKDRIFK